MAKILVVDDDRDMRENIGEVLGDAGFEICLAENGEEAVVLLAETSFNMVILDLVMPGMGGMETLTIIKRNYPSTRVIMATAFSTVDNAVQAMKKGADDYITKPFKIDELLTTVMRGIEEAKFRNCKAILEMDETFSCLANAIRRQILLLVNREGAMRFMDITRKLGVEDHTKVNFHLKVLKEAGLIEQDSKKVYSLSPSGNKVVTCFNVVVQELTT